MPFNTEPTAPGPRLAADDLDLCAPRPQLPEWFGRTGRLEPPARGQHQMAPPRGPSQVPGGPPAHLANGHP